MHDDRNRWDDVLPDPAFLVQSRLQHYDGRRKPNGHPHGHAAARDRLVARKLHDAKRPRIVHGPGRFHRAQRLGHVHCSGTEEQVDGTFRTSQSHPADRSHGAGAPSSRANSIPRGSTRGLSLPLPLLSHRFEKKCTAGGVDIVELCRLMRASTKPGCQCRIQMHRYGRRHSWSIVALGTVQRTTPWKIDKAEVTTVQLRCRIPSVSSVYD